VAALIGAGAWSAAGGLLAGWIAESTLHCGFSYRDARPLGLGSLDWAADGGIGSWVTCCREPETCVGVLASQQVRSFGAVLERERRSVAHVSNYNDRTAKWLHWIARGIGSLVAAFWLFVGIISGINEPEPLTLEGAIMAGLIAASVLGVLIAWWGEGLGGIILLFVAIAHSTFAYIASGHNKGFAMLISGGPWLLVGVLFLTSWRRSTRSGDPQNSA